MTEQNRHTQWFKGIDSIRFVLAFIVILSHLDNPYASELKKNAFIPFKIVGILLANAFDGTTAVIAFFIISGFVIHYQSKNGIANILQFWARRFIRVLLPFLLILIVGSGFGHPEKTVTWSLFCELIYYGIYPFLARIKLSWNFKFILSWLIATLFIVLFAYHDIFALFKQTDNNYQGYYWQSGNYLTWIIGLPCWLLGILIAERIDTLKAVSRKHVWVYRSVVFIIGCFCSFAKFHLHLSYILSMNLFAFVLYKWIEVEIIYFRNKQPNCLLEKMGKISYSLYLCHPIAFLILKQFFVLNTLTYPLFILIAILTAYLYHLIIELPSHKLAMHFKQRNFATKAN